MNLASLIAQLRTGGQGGPTSYGPQGPQGPQLATGGPVYGSPGGGYQGPTMGPQGPGMSVSGGPPQIPQGGFPQGGGGNYGAQAPPMPTSAPQQPTNGGGLQAPPRPPGQPGPGNNGKPWDQRRNAQGFQPGSAAARQWRRQNPGSNPNRPAPPAAGPQAPPPSSAAPMQPGQVPSPYGPGDPNTYWDDGRGGVISSMIGWDGSPQNPGGHPGGLPPNARGPAAIDPRIAALLASMGMGGQGAAPDPSKWWMPYTPTSGGGQQQPPPQQPAPRTVPLRR